MNKKDVWAIIEPRLEEIAKMRKSGYTLEEIATELDLHRKTLERFAKKHESLNSVLQKGKKQLVVDIENSLFRRALGGFIVTKTKVIEVPDRNDPTKMIIERRETTTEVLPPDTGAIVWALRNLAPEKWQDKQIIETTSMGENLEVLKKIMEVPDAKTETPVSNEANPDIQG